MTGVLHLDDGRPASGAAIFLGDDGVTQYQGSTYQYTTYADENGCFELEHVRREKQYTLQAWANGGSIGDVQTTFAKPNITLQHGTTPLGLLLWQTSGRTPIFQIGTFSRQTTGFHLSDHPLQHGLSDLVPSNLTYTIAQNTTADWPFAQAHNGTWTVLFDVTLPVPPTNKQTTSKAAILSLSLAGYTSQNGYGLGAQSRQIPEVPIVGLDIRVNEQWIGTLSSRNATDGAVYRSATTCGGWYFQDFTLPAGVLVQGGNRLDL